MEAIIMDNAIFQLWMVDFPIPRLLLGRGTQYFFEVMAGLYLAGKDLTDNVTSLLWLKESGSPKFLQAAFIRFFSEVMVAP
jgi:hypothetical protein